MFYNMLVYIGSYVVLDGMPIEATVSEIMILERKKVLKRSSAYTQEMVQLPLARKKVVETSRMRANGDKC